MKVLNYINGHMGATETGFSHICSFHIYGGGIEWICMFPIGFSKAASQISEHGFVALTSLINHVMLH